MAICRVEYYDNIGPNEYLEYFDTVHEAVEWIKNEQQQNYDVMCEMFPNLDVVWTNCLFDCGNTMEVYVPDTDFYAECKLIKEDDDSDDEMYCPSATNGDYSPSSPWDAPGMSVRDFI